MKKNLVLIILVFALALAGCSKIKSIVSGGGGSTDSKKALCDSLSGLNTAVQNAKAVSTSTSLSQVKQDGQALEDAWTAVQKAMKKMKEADFNDVRNSYKEIVKSLRNATDAATLQQAVTAIQVSGKNFDTAYAKLNASACTTAQPTP